MEKNKGKHKWKKAFNKESLTKFFDKFGLYLILLTCIGIIGITAILTQGNRRNEEIAGDKGNPSDITVEGGTGDADSSNDIDITITDVSEPVLEPLEEAHSEAPTSGLEAQADNKEEPEDQLKEEPQAQAEDPTQKDVPVSFHVESEGQGISSEMIMPVSGEVIQSYEVDTLVFSQTLKEWGTHTGMDIAGNLGDEVRAALAGTVESIEEDSLKGIVITLSHENDIQTVYIGLSTRDMVKVGQQVERGQVISGIGRTAAFEITEDPHLHFEVWRDGKHDDPEKYLNGK